ncbi:MAG: FtsK/SpoIIIE domain-containing protein [Streptosporangiaceae bacterium]
MPLPEKLHAAALPRLAAAAGNPPASPQPGSFLLGVEDFRSRPVYLGLLARGSHLLMYGDGGSGRTTLLRRVLEYVAATRDPTEVRLHIVGVGRDLIQYADTPHTEAYAFTATTANTVAANLVGELGKRLPPETLSPAELRAGRWLSGPEHVLLVDDYDLTLGPTGSPLTPLVDLLGMAQDIGLHVILARRVAGAQRAAFEAFGQRVREIGATGLIMSGSPTEGPVLESQSARVQPPGRGFFVRRGQRTSLVQCCLDEGEAP